MSTLHNITFCLVNLHFFGISVKIKKIWFFLLKSYKTILIIPWQQITDHNKAEAGWHKLRGIFQSWLDPEFYPQSAYVEIFATFVTKNVVNWNSWGKTVFSIPATKLQCFQIEDWGLRIASHLLGVFSKSSKIDKPFKSRLSAFHKLCQPGHNTCDN